MRYIILNISAVLEYRYRNIGWICLLCMVFCLSACQKQQVYEGSDARLRFSEETICFDTIFTSVTSVTQRLVVTNPYAGDLYLNISLAGGGQSYFSINVDGLPGTSFSKVCIPAKDSIFIFIKVNILPNQQDTPLLVADTLRFLTNGVEQRVELLAFGQDAHFIVADSRVGNIPYKIVAGEGEHTVWTNDKPYVIYGFAVVDSVGKLEIEKGCRIYVHHDGGLWVYKGGCLKVKGTKDEPVVFQGDRTEEFFQKDYAQWNRIWINEGTEDNEINHAIIKNAFIGIQAEVLDAPMGNKLVLSNTSVQKSSGIGLLGRGYIIEAYNNIISDCGQYAVALLQGGDYHFYHNTIYNYYSMSKRSTPSVFFSNFYDVGNVRYLADFSAEWVNNVLFGSQEREFGYQFVPEAAFSASLHHCLLRCDTLFPDVFGSDLILNKDPLLEDGRKGKFAPLDESPCKGAGKYLPQYPLDMTGDVRPDPPTIGAIEKWVGVEE